MSLPTSRRAAVRVPIESNEPLLDIQSDTSSRKEGKRRVWQSQPFDMLTAHLNQPHFALNLFSVVFFCVGCLMLLISSHQQGIKLIMPDCHSETTITQNTNKFVTGGDFYEEQKQREEKLKGSKEFMMPQKKDRKESTIQPIKLNKPPSLPKSNSDIATTALLEFVVPGNQVAVEQAMRLDCPYSEEEHVDYQSLEFKENEDIDMGETTGLKFFIGVTSKCCTTESRQHRDVIRATWMSYAAKNNNDNVDIKFFLAQPDEADAEESIRLLEDEIRANSDIVVVRGRDLYENLPNKTFGMLKYALASPQKYTHVLKTDDDCYVRVHKLIEILDPPGGPQMEGMYKGCLENRGGFWPIRDPNSKWYLSYDELDDYTAQPIRGTKYLAGWGYILSRDLMFHAMKKVYAWDNKLENVPAWYPIMKWEDVLMGILLSDKVSYPDADYHFKAAWRACTNETAIRHLDLDAPNLFGGLYQQELSGLWIKKTVQCSSGSYVAGDYAGWKRWRNSVTEADSRI